MKYIANTNITVNCVYGTYNLVIGEPVEWFVAEKFAQYVTELPEVVVEEEKTTERKGK
jgi:hypothetical protein